MTAITNLVADFETTTDVNDCRVWAYAFCEVGVYQVEYGNSIEDFFDKISRIPARIYFHNLAFDGSFILDAIMKRGYLYTNDKFIGKKKFSTLISKEGKWYSITVKWENGVRTEFRDSLKKLPMAVSSIAKTFGLEETKLSIDYKAYRAPGHQLTQEEIAYIKNDVVIVAKAIDMQLKQGMNKLTVGADSLAEYKRLNKDFKKFFPILSLDCDTDIRSAYRGGYTYAKKSIRGQILGKGRVYDVNSLYPSVMYNRVLPYGFPVWCEGKPEITEEFPLYIVSISFTAKLKPNHIPIIQLKSGYFYSSSEYVENVDEVTTMAITNIDLALWEQQYDLNIISYNGYWKFHGMSGFFNNYIDHWMGIKEKSTGGMRAIAKLHLNSLYGKFATNPDVTGKFPVIDNDIVKLHTGPQEFRNPVYTPMGVFITSYARDVTIRAAQLNYDRFLYCDTDSIHILGDYAPAGIESHPTKLGAWKHESSFDHAIFIRAKCYTEKVDDCTCGSPLDHRRGCGYTTHIAGLPKEVADTVEFSDYYDGHKFDGKLLPRRVSGGIVLTDVKFTLHT